MACQTTDRRSAAGASSQAGPSARCDAGRLAAWKIAETSRATVRASDSGNVVRRYDVEVQCPEAAELVLQWQGDDAADLRAGRQFVVEHRPAGPDGVLVGNDCPALRVGGQARSLADRELQPFCLSRAVFARAQRQAPVGHEEQADAGTVHGQHGGAGLRQSLG
jgi:hypothetical protein